MIPAQAAHVCAYPGIFGGVVKKQRRTRRRIIRHAFVALCLTSPAARRQKDLVSKCVSRRCARERTLLDNFSVPSQVLRGDFAGWLRAAMAERGFSTRMLAARAGVDHSTVYRLATGERQPSLATAMALLRVLAPVAMPAHAAAHEVQVHRSVKPSGRAR
jgi:ribosome-binding protein aMBF1 (putative translation factor)